MGIIPNYLPAAEIFYYLILAVWLGSTAIQIIKEKKINIPKVAVISGTYISWYFGIVYFNNDLVFTFLNVVSHGIPYMALVFVQEFRQKKTYSETHRQKRRPAILRGLFLFLSVIAVLAFLEELFWEVFIWHEHIPFAFAVSPFWVQFLVPLLVVPQLTHYLLDGFIWRRTSAS